MNIKNLIAFGLAFSLHAFGGLFADGITPETALKELAAGNKRFVTHQIRPRQDKYQRASLVNGQEPFAAILCCSDSRVPPEIIFDQESGDIFTVRVAGNVIKAIELESIDYSALHLHSSIIVVMGHQNCGAVHAVIEGQAQDIPAIAEIIKPAVEATKGQPGDRLDNAIKENVRRMVRQVKEHAPIANLIKEKKVEVKGAYYHLSNGEVEFFD